MILSQDEFVRSRSCHNGLFCSAALTYDFTTLETPHILSPVIGFLLCGMVLLPICFSGSNFSPTSMSSVLWRLRTSNAIFSRLLQIFASVITYSAWLSRWTTWFDMFAGVNPSISDTLMCMSYPTSPNAAVVPTAPVIIPTQTCFSVKSSLSSCLNSSSMYIANFIAYVVGRACWPCVRPIVTVLLCSSDRSMSISMSLTIFSRIISIDALSCSDCDESIMSLLVEP